MDNSKVLQNKLQEYEFHLNINHVNVCQQQTNTEIDVSRNRRMANEANPSKGNL